MNAFFAASLRLMRSRSSRCTPGRKDAVVGAASVSCTAGSGTGWAWVPEPNGFTWPVLLSLFDDEEPSSTWHCRPAGMQVPPQDTPFEQFGVDGRRRRGS